MKKQKMHAILLFVLYNFLWDRSGMCSLEFHNFQNIYSFNDLNLPENLTIGSSDVRSRLDCFITCQKTANCVTVFVKLGTSVECKFSEKSTEALSGQLTKGEHFRCFSHFSESSTDNGNTSEDTIYKQSSTAMFLDLVASSSDWSTIDWNQNSDMSLSPSEQSISSQILNPTIVVTLTMADAISSVKSVASTNHYLETPSVTSLANEFGIVNIATDVMSVTPPGSEVSPTKSCYVSNEDIEDTEEGSNDCRNELDEEDVDEISGMEAEQSDGAEVDK